MGSWGVKYCPLLTCRMGALEAFGQGTVYCDHNHLFYIWGLRLIHVSAKC